MTDRDKAIEAVARALAAENTNTFPTPFQSHDYRRRATALIDKIAPLLVADAIARAEADKAAAVEAINAMMPFVEGFEISDRMADKGLEMRDAVAAILQGYRVLNAAAIRAKGGA